MLTVTVLVVEAWPWPWLLLKEAGDQWSSPGVFFCVTLLYLRLPTWNSGRNSESESLTVHSSESIGLGATRLKRMLLGILNKFYFRKSIHDTAHVVHWVRKHTRCQTVPYSQGPNTKRNTWWDRFFFLLLLRNLLLFFFVNSVQFADSLLLRHSPVNFHKYPGPSGLSAQQAKISPKFDRRLRDLTRSQCHACHEPRTTTWASGIET